MIKAERNEKKEIETLNKGLRQLFLNAINERYDLINALDNVLKWSAHFPPAMDNELKNAKDLLEKLKKDLK